MTSESLEPQLAELVGLIRGAVAEQQRLMESAVEHYRRALANVLTDHSATVHETRSEGAKALQELTAIAKQGAAILQKQNEFLAEVRRGLKDHIETAAATAGRDQAIAFGKDIVGAVTAGVQAGIVERLHDGASRAIAAADVLEHAARQLDWKTKLVSAGVAAGCSLGLLLAVLFAWHWFVPNPERVHELQAESERLNQVVAQLTDKGGEAILSSCADHGKNRKCIRTDESAGTFIGKDGQVYRVIQGY
ncbi:MAG TPA: hypothetical protein VN848_07650 [Gemmatimonadales bacterium]|nr:hypothetical protein [Gemmatimonadales bacterium]